MLEDLETIFQEFSNFVKDKPMGVDRTEHIYLVAVDDVWEDAIEAFLHYKRNESSDCNI